MVAGTTEDQANGSREYYIDSLRKELLYLIERELTPLAMKYQYSEVPLESRVRWKPLVLVLGNYSSGKSTLINEFLGTKIQLTGQAPTDDCFTVITAGDDDAQNLAEEEDSAAEVRERDGRVLLHDDQYPFGILKKYGERLSSHFRLKQIKGVPALKSLAIIDTPGMLDSVTEKDRGYNYQEVIGDLAQIADLVLILFDPHKAGTVRESYASLRETLPSKSFEDRLVFILNRVDECGNIEDLLRVYGTLCWNLSQMTGRKDIPRILLTYAHKKTSDSHKPFLDLLDNQRSDLQNLILNAPRKRLDHLASFVEHHSGRLLHMLDTMIEFSRSLSGYRFRLTLPGLLLSILAGVLTGIWLDLTSKPGEISDEMSVIWGVLVIIISYTLWNLNLNYLCRRFFQKKLNQLEEFGNLSSQQQKDSWNYIADPLRRYLSMEKKPPSLSQLKKQRELVRRIYVKGAQEIRSAINELSTLQEFQNPVLKSTKAQNPQKTADPGHIPDSLPN
ncbi:MAG: dynamin family protein [Deltaproteobacteria bacterium]|nr:dynamin family protein [Deltaproteobacteria bacterium]